MSLITGTIVDSAGNPLSGNLVITLAGSINKEGSPSTLFVTQPKVIYITNGVVNIALEESETSKVSYKFEFFVETSPDEFNTTQPSPFPFFAVIPNLSPVDLIDLTPTGMVNDALSTGALRIARIIANDPELSSNVGGLTPKGNWVDTTYYKNRDLVSYESKVYICRAVNPIQGIIPIESSPYWMLLPITP
jgi:hypothetical protein